MFGIRSAVRQRRVTLRVDSWALLDRLATPTAEDDGHASGRPVGLALDTLLQADTVQELITRKIPAGAIYG